MKVLIVLFFFSAMAVYSQVIYTPLEQNNYESLTSYSQMISYLEGIVKAENNIRMEYIAESVEGRKIPVLKMSIGEFGNDNSKARVLIFAQQHGDEQSGKEGTLLLIGEILKPENLYLFSRIDLALVPQMNPDGSEKNQRKNGNDADLNRNHLILSEPETTGLHSFFNKYLFEVTMDVHEYSPFGETWKKYGYRENNDEEIGTLTNINVSARIRHLSDNIYLPFIKQYLYNKGYSFFEYCPGGPPEINYIRHSTFDINDGRQSFGILNSLSFILEGLNGEDNSIANIRHRAEGQMSGMLGLLEFVYQHKDEIKNLVASEREKLIKSNLNNKAAIQLDHFGDGRKLELPLLSYYSNVDTLITVNDYRPVVKSLYDVIRPAGYLVPKYLKEIIDWADKHSVKYCNFKRTGNQKIEQYHISGIDSINFEGDIIVNPITEVKEIKDILPEADYVYIPTKQLRNNMIVIALEPKSELGLVTYKNFEHLLRKNEDFPILRVINK